MAKTPLDLLARSWKSQVDHLRSLSRKDMELLWFDMQEHKEAFDRLYLAVFSILRDMYEAKARAGTAENRPSHPGPGNSEAQSWKSGALASVRLSTFGKSSS